MDEYARPDYIDNVYSYYGVSPGPRPAVGASGGAKVRTDVTGTAGATASPGEVAGPAAAGTAPPDKRPSARMHAGPVESPDGASRENPSPKAIRKARAIGTQPQEGRGETASQMMTEESSSEATPSPSENKKSRRKGIEDTSTRKPSATPPEGED